MRRLNLEYYFEIGQNIEMKSFAKTKDGVEVSGPKSQKRNDQWEGDKRLDERQIWENFLQDICDDHPMV